MSKKIKIATASAIAVIIVAVIAFLCICTDMIVPKVAATINGHQIMESEVTAEIQDMRASGDLMDSKKWAQYLVNNGETPESVRKATIESIAQGMLLEDAAIEAGAMPSDDEIEADIARVAEERGMTSEEYVEQFIADGGDRETLYGNITSSLIIEKLTADSVEALSVTDDEILEAVNSYSNILDGTREYSVIALELDDMDNAKQIADAVKKNPSEFDSIAADKSVTDEYDGWFSEINYDYLLFNSLANAKKGDIIGPVEGGKHILIVRIDDVFNMPSDMKCTSVSEIPTGIVDNYKDAILVAKQNEIYANYQQELVESATIEINPMPMFLPYDVSLDGVTPDKGYERPTGNEATDDMYGVGHDEEAENTYVVAEHPKDYVVDDFDNNKVASDSESDFAVADNAGSAEEAANANSDSNVAVPTNVVAGDTAEEADKKSNKAANQTN